MENAITLYRYDGYDEYALKHPNKFTVISETKCGYWIKGSGIEGWYDTTSGKWKEGKMWVSKTGKKRFAYPTKEEALVNFIARKKRQIICNKANIMRAEMALRMANAPQVSVLADKKRLEDYDLF